MTENPPVADDPFALWIRRRPTLAATLYFLAFIAGTLIGIWFARKPDPQGNNPAQVLLLVWVIGGLSHIVIRALWLACFISAIASAIGYVALVAVFFPKGLENEMFGVGVIIATCLGAGAAFVLGAPVLVYRRVHARNPKQND